MNAIGRRIDRLERGSGKGNPWPALFHVILLMSEELAHGREIDARLTAEGDSAMANYRAVYGDGGPYRAFCTRGGYEPTKQED